MSPKVVSSQIRQITGNLISAGMAIDQNFPAIRQNGSNWKIGIPGELNLSATLRNVSYATAYETLRAERAFNFLLIDGGIVQLLYTFDKGSLVGHRLAFFPSPDLVEYQNSPEIYEDDERFGDVIEKGVVTTPLRFDYDPSSFVELDHPRSHFTIGQYRNCRIPVAGPLPPAKFCSFILRSFYNTPARRFLAATDALAGSFPHSITPLEREHVHVGA